MKTLIIYDSVFGNTQKIAEAIGMGADPDQIARKLESAGGTLI